MEQEMDEVINQLQRLRTADLSDAQSRIMGGANWGCFSCTRIHNLNQQAGTICGYAITCTIETTNQVKGSRTTPVLYHAIEASRKPVVLAIQGIGQDLEHSCVFGGKMAAISKKLGASGVITNAGVRDMEDIINIGFGCYASGVCPSAGTFTIRDVNVALEIDGTQVQPGNIIHGDKDGFIVLENGYASELIRLAREMNSEEQRWMTFIDSSDFSVSELKKRYYR
jgi:4-hydroxy-4-methyl-2-oxoglutarate aldolase